MVMHAYERRVLMALTARRPHWKIGQAEPDRDDHGVPQPDPRAKRYACFTLSEHAAEWLLEQLAERTVAELGGFESAADWADWVRRQGTQDEEADAEQRHAAEGGTWTVIAAEIGGIEYRMEVCTCTGEVTGRCHNPGCDRETDYDTEPGYGYGSYTRWSTNCYRCYYPERAHGGFTGRDPRPIPRHPDEGDGQVRKLIEDDRWTGWRCVGEHDDGTKCDRVWRFAEQNEWASRYRLTRMWDGKVTGTEGYALTEEEAHAEAQLRTRESRLYNRGFTVGVEKINQEGAQ